MANASGGIPEAMQSDIRDLLQQESATNRELSEVLARIKKARDARDRMMKDPKSKTNKQLDTIEQKITTLLDKKNALYDEMNALRTTGPRGGGGGNEQASLAENLALLRLKRIPLREKQEALQEDFRRASARAAEQRLKADKLRLRFPPVEEAQGQVVTLAEMEKVMKRLGERIAKAEKNPAQQTALEHLKGQKKLYEKWQPSLEEYWGLIETSFDAKAKEQICRKELDQVNAELQDVEDKMKALSERQRPLPEDGKQEKEKERAERTERTEKLRAEVQDLVKEIERLKQEKQRVRDSSKSGDGSQQSFAEELKEATAARDALFEKLKQIREQVPSRTMAYNKAYHSDLIGPKGATIQGLQEDFGVLLNVNYDKGELTLKGSVEDMEACARAVEELLRNAQDSRCSATMKFDPAVSRELIGPGGTNIQKMQEASGARINVDSKTSTITITGPQAAVAVAQQVLTEFFAGTCRAVVPFKPDLGDAVVGRQGRTVKRIQEESGAKNINIRKETGTIEIVGSREAVDAAKEMYEDLLKSFQSGGMEMKLAPEMVGAIVGKGGANIMKIQDDTGCLLNVNRAPAAGGRGAKGGHATITIKGPSAGVNAARAMIEEILFANSREVEKVPFEPSLRMFLIRPPKDDPSAPCPLEKIKRDSNCQRVEALRGENFVAVSGRKECIAAAVQQLRELLRANARDTVKVEYPPVLFGALGVREDGKDSAMDAVRKEFGCEAVTADKSGTISVVGEATAAAAAVAKIREMVDAMKEDIETLVLTSERAFPIIIGSGGQNINRIRRETKTEIQLDRGTMQALIYGTPAARAKARETLEKIIADAAP